MIALHDLLVTGHPAQTPVCRDGGTTFDFAAFRARVVTLASGLHAHTAVRYALCIDDTFDFACALFALLACGKEPVIPANATPDYLADLAGAYDVMWTDAGLDPGTLETPRTRR